MKLKLRSVAAPLAIPPSILGVAILFSVPLAGPADAQLLPPGSPAGSISLVTVRSKQVGAAKCAFLKGRWEPGQVSKKVIFLSRKQQIANVRKTVKGKRAKTQIARLQKQLKTETKACNKKTPLRLSLNDVAAVSVASGPISTTKNSARSAQAKSSANSNLAAMLPNGAIRDAILSGTIKVADVSTGPSGDLYLAFGAPNGAYGTPVDLTDATTSLVAAGDSVATGRRLCTIAKVDIKTGVPTCVDTYNKDNHCGWLRDTPSERVQIEVLPSGDVYYRGKQCNIPIPFPMLTRVRSGVEKFMTPELPASPPPGVGDPFRNAIKVAHYAAADDGSVFVSTYTGTYTPGSDSTYKEAFYRIAPDGTQEEVAPRPASFIERFPDGNIYYALNAGGAVAGGFRGVRRYLTGTGFDPVPWFGQPREPVAEWRGEPELAHQPYLCFPESPRQANASFCSSDIGAAARMGFGKTTNGYVYAAPGFTSGDPSGFGSIPPVLYQYYPTLQRITTVVEKVRIVAGADRKILVTGLDSSGANVTTAIDPESGSERTIIGAAENIRVGSLNYSKRMGKAIFVGTRQSDGSQVAGTVDLDSGALEIRPFSPTTFSSTMAALG